MNSDRLLNLFFHLVRIESPSRGEGAMAAFCARELQRLGFMVTFDDSMAKTGSETGNLVATRKGDVDGEVILSAHLDTVTPCRNIDPIIEDGRIVSAGKTILAADDKAGIAAILEAVRTLVESGEPMPTVTVLFTVCEEISLVGAANFDAGLLPEGAPCYVLDADGAPGSVIIAAPCHRTVQARFHGRAAHAGVEPELGNSAIVMAARAIAAMPLGRLDDATTSNIGVIEGGAEENIVPRDCLVRGECRSLLPERADEVQAAMTAALAAAAEEAGGEVAVEWHEDYPAVSYAEDDALVQGIASACAAAGLTFRPHRSGGGADANILASRGVRAVTLGIGMTNFHTLDEYITVVDLQDITRLAEELIRQAVE